MSFAVLPSFPVGPYKGYLDPTFDKIFDDLKLSWLPWVGRSYQKRDRKTIVLGESIYAYKVKDKGVSSLPAGRAKIDVRTSLRDRHLSHGIEANHPSAFVRAFERAVFLKKAPNRADRERLWCEVIYHNLSPERLGSLAERPGNDAYENGWRAFLKMRRRLVRYAVSCTDTRGARCEHSCAR